MENKPETYDCTYTFSTEQQNEIKKIRSKYLPLEEDKMEQLRKLDKSTAIPGTAAAFLTGMISLAIHGVGSAMVKTGTLFIPGTVLAFAGLLGLLSAYPIYHYVTKKQRAKAAPDILKLCDELLK